MMTIVVIMMMTMMTKDRKLSRLKQARVHPEAVLPPFVSDLRVVPTKRTRHGA